MVTESAKSAHRAEHAAFAEGTAGRAARRSHPRPATVSFQGSHRVGVMRLANVTDDPTRLAGGPMRGHCTRLRPCPSEGCGSKIDQGGNAINAQSRPRPLELEKNPKYSVIRKSAKCTIERAPVSSGV